MLERNYEVFISLDMYGAKEVAKRFLCWPNKRYKHLFFKLSHSKPQEKKEAVDDFESARK